MTANQSAPRAAVVPILIYDDVPAAIDWLCTVFGFRERLRAADRDGVVGHAQLVAGTGDIMIGRAGTRLTAPRAGAVHQYVLIEVENVDRHFAHAQACGATIVQPVSGTPFGARQYTAVDPAGHWWTFSQNVADVHPSAWGAVLKP